jgi:sec-independent protein translocase protein TatA
MSSLFAFLGGLGAPEIIVLVILGVLLFGRKLPDVGRYLGKSIVEFKKGVKGLEDDLDTGTGASPVAEPQNAIRPPQRVAATAPKFEDSPAPAPTPPKV